MAAAAAEMADAGSSTHAAAADGPLSLLYRAVKNGEGVLISLRNQKRLLAVPKAFDRHMNLVLENAVEMWTEKSKSGKSKGKAIHERTRKIGKMFLRGDSVVLIVKAAGAEMGEL